MSSWSNLANTLGNKPPAGEVQSASMVGQSLASAKPAMKNASDSFEAFKQQAKERQQLIGLLEQQKEQKRREQEQKEKEKR